MPLHYFILFITKESLSQPTLNRSVLSTSLKAISIKEFVTNFKNILGNTMWLLKKKNSYVWIWEDIQDMLNLLQNKIAHTYCMISFMLSAYMPTPKQRKYTFLYAPIL